MMRFDLSIIASWIKPGSKVLDLGCGEGDLLYYLQEEKGVEGTGIEITESKVMRCIEKGLTVLQGDITEEVADYPDQCFDYVILSQTLQQVYAPDQLIEKLVGIGKMVILSFPNFTYWRNRFSMAVSGRAPISKQLPYEWYNTPNIRVIAFDDFHRFIKKMGWEVIKKTAINTDHHEQHGNIISVLPNLRASYGIFMLAKKQRSRL